MKISFCNFISTGKSVLKEFKKLYFSFFKAIIFLKNKINTNISSLREEW